jgi:hypothetical protein
MAYMIRSRCTKIRCCGLECERDVIKLTAEDLTAMEGSGGGRQRGQRAAEVREIEVIARTPPV